MKEIIAREVPTRAENASSRRMPGFRAGEQEFMDPARVFLSVAFGCAWLFCTTFSVKSNGVELPFRPGESLSYRISWSNIVEAGSAQLRVTAVDGKPNLLRIALKATTSAAVAATYPFSDDFVSYFDTVLRAPSIYEKNFTERKRVVKERITLDQLQGLALFTNSRNQSRRLQIDLGTQDPVSSLYALRSLGLSPGMQVTFQVIDSGNKYWLESRVVGTELITIKLGSFNTHRVEISLRKENGRTGNQSITAWFTTDASRVPVLLSVAMPVGAAVVELTERTP